LKGISNGEIQKRLAPLAFFPKEAPTITELLELFPGHSLEQLFELCDYLKLSRSERDIVRFLYHAKQMLNMPQEWQTKLEKIEWAQFYASPYEKICLEIIAAHLSLETRKTFLKEHNQRKLSLEAAIQRICSQTPIVRADHLMNEGISPGRKMGLLLKEAERISVNEGIDNSETIIQLLKNSSLWNT
jgi:poly(A) polymerase